MEFECGCILVDWMFVSVVCWVVVLFGSCVGFKEKFELLEFCCCKLEEFVLGSV